MTGETLSVESFFRICLWQSIVLAAVGLAASFVLRQRSSRAHQVLLMSIVAAMIVPVISMLVKHYELGMFVAEPVAMQPQSNAQFPASSLSSPSRIAQDFGYEAGPIEEDVPSVTTGQQRSAILWAHIALCAWPAASLILVIRLIMTFLSGTHLLGRSQPLACAKMEHAVRSAKARLGIYKPVEVRSSRGVRSPVIWCWRRRPVLLVPCAAGRGENGVDWTGVLCHELAHWKRRDHISGLLAELAVCALPWHVLLWWARFRLTSLSEKACDDWVLATGQAGADYAESLLELTPGRQMAFVPAVVSSRKELAGRVRRILRDSCGNPRMGAAWAVAVSIVAACIAIGVAFAQTRPAGSEEDEDNNSLTERFELNKDIAIKLDIGPDGMHKTINARSVRFDKTDSGMRATLRADVRRGLPFEWKTMIETVKLDYVDADEVAKRLKEAIQQMPGTELQQGVLIQPLTLARQVIIFGRKDLREKVKKLIAEIDSPLDMERLRPRIVALSNSDPAQMAELLTALFAAEGGGRVNMIVFGKVTEEERKTVGQLSDRLTFESVPGTSKLIVISGIAEAYDPVERLILELDRQNMAAKDVKEVRQWIRNRGHEPTRTALPAGWTLDYDDGILAGGGRRWPANMAKDLASLEIRLKPYDPREASLKGEEYEFRAYSLEGTQVGSISVRPESERHVPRSKIFKPGKYLLEYRRRWGPSGDNFRIESGQYPIDLSKPGMYELTFTPKIGAAKITGTLGGCYAINFERIGSAPWVRGFAYVDPRLDKQYLLDGLPPGKYLLSAVTQRQSDNVFVDQAELTIAAGEKIAVDMARPAKGSCTLKGTLLGKQRKYATPWPDTWPQSQGKWYVLIRKPGSGAVGRVDAYEALTMDSLYVVRGRNLTQQTKDRATYRIEGVAPGDYTVTAIEHPSWGGCVVTRQQSRRLVLRPGENVLDFDLRDVSQPRDNPGAKDIESAPAPESRRRTDEEIESTRPRIISFPKGQSMGKLFVRDPGADNWYEGWQELGEAIGDVSVDAGKEVKLEISEQSAGDLSPLAGLRTDDLEMLCFGWRPVRVGSLEPIGNLSGLKALNIQRAKFDSEDFRHLTGLTQLEVLRCGDYKLSDESMRYVGQLTSLRSLALWGTGISDEGLKHLQGLRNLTFLAMNNCEIKDEGLDYLKNMTALEGLQIYQTKITDYGLAELQGLSRLKHIKLGYNGITDKGLKHLENLTSLENIWLDSNPITDEGLPYLAGMKNLKQLYIPRTRVTDAGLVHLKGMKDFDHLLIDGISDEGIRHLSELPDLEFLQIQDSRVTKASIPDFKRMNSLNRVLLSGDRVNDDLLDALRAALPTCKIWDPQRSLDYPMPEWRKRFEAVYRLEDGQVLKRIAPPFIPERRDYYLNEETLQARHIRRSPDHFTFEWTGKLKKWGMGFGTGSHPLGRVLGNDLIVERDRFEGSEELMRIEVPGDWIVREGVSVGEKLKALEKILADELGRNIRFVKRTVERQAIVATGRFKFRPLPAAKDSKWVHVFVGDFDPDAGGSGGTAGSVADFLGAFGDDLDIAMINQTEPSGQIQVPYRNRLSRLPSTLGRMADPTKKANLLTEVLNNVSLQTNLKFEVTRRGVEVWHVSEVGNAR